MRNADISLAPLSIFTYPSLTAMRNLLKILLILLVFVLSIAHDTLNLTDVQQIAAPYQFNFVSWETMHLSSKWWHLFLAKAFPYQQSDQEKRDQLDDYFRLQDELGVLQGALDEAAAAHPEQLPNLEQRQSQLQKQINSLKPWVEETLESLITDELRRQGIPFQLGPFVFPPVDIALDPLPTILITSPRDRIERTNSYLLNPDLTPSTRDSVENAVLREEDLSALVENLGGLSTFPAIVYSRGLRSALIIGSHEWLHNYLFFKPLGRNYNRDGNMNSLNETTANIFGDEIGWSIYHLLTGEPIPEPQPPGEPEPCPEDQFCFNREMHETRSETDDLLAQGKVEEAEAYMEQRRGLFVENGYFIRKLNQAYFAFHGTYADSPSSASPINAQLRQLRDASSSLAKFIHTMQGTSTYDAFLQILEQLPTS